jgi:hypothetical protein
MAAISGREPSSVNHLAEILRLLFVGLTIDSGRSVEQCRQDRSVGEVRLAAALFGFSREGERDAQRPAFAMTALSLGRR